MIRRTAAALLIAGCLAGTGCSSSGRPKSEFRGHTVEIAPEQLAAGGSDTLRLGRIRAGEIVRTEIGIRNRTQRPLAITGYERACGCTEFDCDLRPILPGETRRAAVLFDSQGEWGWQFRKIELFFADAPQPWRLWIEAEVE